MPTINLSPPIDKELEKFSKWEYIFDNKAFQPIDYFDNCIFLGIDPEQPRLPGIHLQDQFKSWQVTGITKIIRIYQEKQYGRCILVDLIGLGKT
jgi:hypothetical protein